MQYIQNDYKKYSLLLREKCVYKTTTNNIYTWIKSSYKAEFSEHDAHTAQLKTPTGRRKTN